MTEQDPLKPVRSILVSQPEPSDVAKAPFYFLEEKYGIKVTYRSFIKVEPVPAKDFRKNHIDFAEITAGIFTTKFAIDYFFAMCKEMRFVVSQDFKYFCLSENIANYLQTYIHMRKRKVFFGERVFSDMKEVLLKHKKKEKFFVPTSNTGTKGIVDFMTENNFDFKEGMLYQTVSADLSEFSDITYDMLVFFTPFGIKSLFENFPDFKQNETRIAVFGESAQKAALEAGIKITIPSSLASFSAEAPAITTAIEAYVHRANAVIQ